MYHLISQDVKRNFFLSLFRLMVKLDFDGVKGFLLVNVSENFNDGMVM